MNVSKMTLPYPVLGINDDVLPRPSMENSSLSQTKTHYIFEFDAICKNEKILDLIADGYAEYVCEVNCQRTFLRKCHKQNTPHFRIEVPKHGVSGTIEFEVTITVKKPIAEYTNPQFHEDYTGYSFNLEPGDLLGFIAAFTYDADIKYDKLQAVGSFMEINQNSTDATAVELGHPKISILLPPDMYQAYKGHVHNNRQIASVIHASLVFNALTDALNNINEHRHELWAKTIIYRLKTEDGLKNFYVDDETLFEQDKVFDLAQALLGDPYKRLFNCLDCFIGTFETN